MAERMKSRIDLKLIMGERCTSYLSVNGFTNVLRLSLECGGKMIGGPCIRFYGRVGRVFIRNRPERSNNTP